MEPISALTAAYQGLNIALNSIDKLVQYRAQKKLEKLQREHAQQQFLHQFIYAAAPDPESQEVETLRSYCRKLQNIIRAHWGFIFGRGRKNTETAHAVIASTLFHVGAMPGLPTSPQSAPNLVAGIYIYLEDLQRLRVRKSGDNVPECNFEVILRCC
jgi:hypothetical protein